MSDSERRLLYEDIRERADREWEAQEDRFTVDNFADEMKLKLYRSMLDKGRYGWRRTDPFVLKQMLLGHVEKGDAVDVANFAMMIWWHDQQDALAQAKDKDS